MNCGRGHQSCKSKRRCWKKLVSVSFERLLCFPRKESALYVDRRQHGPLCFDEPPVWFAVTIGLSIIAASLMAIKFIGKLEDPEQTDDREPVSHG